MLYDFSRDVYAAYIFGEEEVISVAYSGKKPYVIEISEVTDENGDGAVDLTDFELILKKNKPKILKGDGDFRSAECIEYLKEADIVVTNPHFPFQRIRCTAYGV